MGAAVAQVFARGKKGPLLLMSAAAAGWSAPLSTGRLSPVQAARLTMLATAAAEVR
jgi:hypothetical protein